MISTQEFKFTDQLVNHHETIKPWKWSICFDGSTTNQSESIFNHQYWWLVINDYDWPLNSPIKVNQDNLLYMVCY